MNDELKIYEVTNRDTGERHLAVSYNAQDACKQAGWLMGDCFIVEQKPTRKPTPDGETGLLYKVPCRLSKKDYHSNRKWIPLEQAIEELGTHH